ncbi:MAG: signal peptidase I [Clostridia bacterium]|nr:signal peptidase I [Clostridia bacterium]
MQEENKTVEGQEIRTETIEEPEETGKKHKKNKKEKPKRPLWQEILSWVWPLLGALAIALVVRTLLFEPVKVDGSSMLDTLNNGEIMFVDKTGYSSFWVTWPWGSNEAKEASEKWTFFGNPERFDPVVCRYPDRGTTNFVKRVVGLPGDTVEVKDGYLYVNGEKYDEPYVSDNYRAGETWGDSILVPKKGDIITYDGEQFKVNGSSYDYAFALVNLEGEAKTSIRMIRVSNGLSIIGTVFRVMQGKETYFTDGSTWLQLVSGDGDGSLSYYDNQQQIVTVAVKQLDTAPFAANTEFTVTEDDYFVMGDHRNNSRDSRWCGAIPRSYVMGRVRQIIWPLGEWRSVVNGLEFSAE